MKKQDVEKLLGNGRPDFDLGPIELQLHALATERRLPEVAIGLCTIRIEESSPALRAVVTKAADGASLSDDEQRLLFRGIYILGAARDSLACQPLLRLLRRPARELDRLLGDALTETMSRIVAGVFDDDVDALFGTISDRSVDEFAREALLGAATFLTWEGRIGRDRMRHFLERFHAERLAGDDDQVWIAWLEAIALLGLRDLAPLVHDAWDEGRVPPGVLDRTHFEKDLDDAERKPRDIGRFKRANLGYIEDVLAALDWVRGLDEAIDPAADEWPWSDREWLNSMPAENPFRDVGRNDPCPCGSGKKFKKCCLDN